MKTHCSVLALLAAAVIGSSASAASIDFESLPVGTVVANQFSGLGVTFSSSGNPTQPIIRDPGANSSTGQVLSDFSIVGGIDITADFSSPVIDVSALLYANPQVDVIVSFFGPGGVLLATMVGAGDGVSFNHGTVGLAAVPVSRVSWTTSSSNAAVSIDNLSFTAAPTGVPHVGTLPLLGLGLASLALVRSRRSALAVR